MSGLTHREFLDLWASLNDDQRQSVRDKCSWEHMSAWAVCNEWPGIWNDPHRLRVIQGDRCPAAPTDDETPLDR